MDYTKSQKHFKPFDGEKYSAWKIRIRVLLEEHKVLYVVDDAVPEKPDDKWVQDDCTAKRIIIDYLSDSFLKYAKGEMKACEILKSLDEIYERKSLATQITTWKNLLTLKLEGDTPLTKHFQNFEDLIDILVAAGATVEEPTKVALLLVTLPTSYESIVTAIETLAEDNMTLCFVKLRLLDHETKLKMESVDCSAKVLQATKIKNNFKSKKVNNNAKMNYKYNKNNNKKKQFFKNNFNSDKNKFSKKCDFCGRRNHEKNDCYFFKKPNETEGKTAELASSHLAVINNDAISGFAFMVNDQTLTSSNKLCFILDSGSSDHIINRDDLFEKSFELQPCIKIGTAKTGVYLTAKKKGNVSVISDVGVQGTLEDVLYCPDSPHNLLSVRRLQKKRMRIVFDEHGGIEVIKDGKCVIRGKPLNNDLLIINFKIPKKKLNGKRSAFTVSNFNNYKLWHQRFGHISKSKFLKLQHAEMVNNITEISKILPDDDLCEPCINGKQTRLPFNKIKNKEHVTRPLFIIHSDVCGPINPLTMNNKKYYVVFIDQYTHYSVTYLMSERTELFTCFKDFVEKSEAHFNLKIVHLYSDNGGEYISNDMKNYCSQKGISYHLTVPHTPQLNGVSERMIRTITEKARAMVDCAKLQKEFWGEAVLTATYLINITPTKALTVNKTPFEMWHKKKPDIKYLRVFGSTVYTHNKVRKTKFDEKSWKAILVGFAPNGI